MKIKKTLCLKDRSAWRSWLSKNYSSEKEIWLVYYKKGGGKKSISYNEAVEEALCFGWIDSTAKKLDEERYSQRFTPRRKGSKYSQLNKERLRLMLKQNKIIPSLKGEIKILLMEEFVFPEDIIAEIRKSGEAWKNYKRFPDAYKRIRISFIHEARDNPAEFRKRLNYFVKMSEKGKYVGMPGTEKYFLP